jgi:hypothetical protein
MRTLLATTAIVALLVTSGSTVPAQTTATREVMRVKLGHAGQVLEALMTSDFTQLEREAASLAALTGRPAWAVLTSERYVRYSDTFRRAAEDLAAFAEERDSEAAMRAYVALTLSCYQCHSYVKGARVAQ